mmetsp:Transcript_44562/g.59131  ORF Transcript_44562/g.59131 Transcript_44562/m.59131 type:complete len:82 (+) Transcript_44562:1120-1365(+)
MNYEMMLLADCVTVFSDRALWPKASKQELISYIKSVAEVAEVRAVAYHDIAVSTIEASHEKATSNLFRAWYLMMMAASSQK